MTFRKFGPRTEPNIDFLLLELNTDNITNDNHAYMNIIQTLTAALN